MVYILSSEVENLLSATMNGYRTTLEGPVGGTPLHTVSKRLDAAPQLTHSSLYWVHFPLFAFQTHSIIFTYMHLHIWLIWKV